MNSNKISILITTKNEEKNLPNLLNSIYSQSYKNFEIIIVDNFSTDRTKEIVEKYKEIFFFQKGPERGHQRAYGIEKCSGEVIFWPDADHIISDNLLEEINLIEKKYNNNKCLFIPERIIENNFFNKTRNFERSFYDGTAIDCPRVIPKKVFLKILSEQKKTVIFNSGADDWDIYNYCEIYSDFGITKNIILHNETNLSFLNYLKKKKSYMKSMSGFQKKWQLHHLNKIRFNPIYRLFIIFFKNGGYKKILKNPFLFISTLSIRSIVGLIYLVYK